MLEGPICRASSAAWLNGFSAIQHEDVDQEKKTSEWDPYPRDVSDELLQYGIENDVLPREGDLHEMHRISAIKLH
ncbi:hypothetical protein A9Z06_31465 [Rhizobium sp. YK2]|nr:hypothetical protein A9Z06_31465 [Rhizobium sp. YK2]